MRIAGLIFAVIAAMSFAGFVRVWVSARHPDADHKPGPLMGAHAGDLFILTLVLAVVSLMLFWLSSGS